jgi:site-specific recombinase XerD
MSKAKLNPLPGLVRGFFTHLMAERQLSPCTISSYGDSFRLLINYLEGQTHRCACEQHLEDWDAPQILGFLEHLEKKRHCCARTRNARLAALHSFMKYIARHCPESMVLAQRVLAIPSKRYAEPQVGYLTTQEVQAILDLPSDSTPSGQRDRLFFQLLYNTGARVSELLSLNREDFAPAAQSVSLHGKGRKERSVPLWSKTARHVRQWLQHLPQSPSTPVFSNRFGNRLSRSGIEKRLRQAARQAAESCPSLRARRVSPHLFRHTTAMHLLQSGVEMISIALWLGHASLLTTHKYIEADLEMKKKTLNRLKQPNSKPSVYQPKDALLAFLEGLKLCGHEVCQNPAPTASPRAMSA